MAGGSDLVDVSEQGVRIAVDREGADLLEVARRLTFEPEFFAAAAIVVHQAGRNGFFKSFLVHVSLHQDFLRTLFADDDWYSAMFVQFELRPVSSGQGQAFTGGAGFSIMAAGLQLAFMRRANSYAAQIEVTLEGGNRDFAEMEQAGRQNRIGAALDNAIVEIGQLAGTAGSNNRNRDTVGDLPGDPDVIAAFSAVSVHAGQQDFASAELFDLGRPFDGIKSCIAGTAGDHDFIAAERIFADIDRHDNALAAKTFRSLGDQGRVLDCGRIEGDLVGSGLEQDPDIFERPDTAANCEGDENLLGHLADDVDQDAPLFERRRNIQEDQLIGAGSL